jgi:hypothetical protein
MFAASKSGSAAAKDPQFNYVTMLLHGDGTNGAQNNTFLDSSTNNFTITRNGNTTQGTFTPYGSNWSNYFDGSSYLSTTAASISGADFTIEAWVYLTATSNSGHLFSFGTNEPNRFSIYRDNANNKWSLAVVNGGSYTITAATNTAIANTWNHVAFVRSGTTNYLYVNGVREASNTASLNSGTARYMAGNFGISTDNIYGYVSNFRVSTSALYTGTTYTVPTAPFVAGAGTNMLTCQSNRFIDTSSNAYSITLGGSPSVQRFSPFSPTSAYSTSVIGGSGYFDGSGDRLTAAGNTAFNLGTGNFTIEFTIYPTAFSSRISSYCNGLASNSNFAFYVDLNSNGTITADATSGSTEYSVTSSSAINLNSFTHVAFVRTTTTLTLYFNGVSVGTSSIGANSVNALSGATLTIGSGLNGNGGYYTGFITDFRWVTGTAVYTSAFTPPTAPLTAITNTSLLLSNTNAGILDNAEMNDLETVGNAQISTSVKKYGTGSMYFDGAGDYLTVPNSQNLFSFGTGDFTIECWVYYNSIGSDQGIVDCRAPGDGLANWILNVQPGGVVDFIYGATRLRTSGLFSTGSWVHIAVTRASGTIRIFVNGTNSASATYTSAIDSRATVPNIGRAIDPAYMNGYIDDLRITKGYARYTANFTPPTAAFPNN